MNNLIFFPGKRYSENALFSVTDNVSVKNIPVEMIVSNPFQARKNYDGDSIIRLADSIRRYGIIEPISVRKFASGKYEVVFGERRLRAAKLIDLETVPCMIMENISRKTSCELNYIENNMREPLDINEKAVSVETLMRRFDMPGEQVCKNLSVYRDEMKFLFGILRLSQEERTMISSLGISAGQLKALMKIDNVHVRRHLMRRISENGVPDTGCERFIEEFMHSPGNKKSQVRSTKPRAVKKLVLKDLRFFTNSVDKAVETVKTSGANVSCEKKVTENGVEYVISVSKDSK
ncbi:MAG: ParB/RepB/Spo0J family partition protein [Clostridia bacterium]|nr:ParB/RepB/Spo0J family partition protein [Clostridia bacterium]